MTFSGGKYLNDCPVQPKLPVYLIVGGAAGLLKAVTMLWKNKNNTDYEKFEDTAENSSVMDRSSAVSEGLISLFMLCWLIVGNSWLFSIHPRPPNFEPPLQEPKNYCKKAVYTVALTQICVAYGLVGLFLLLLIGLVCYRKFSTVSKVTEHCMELPATIHY